jgi:hypothetical protein
VLAHPDGAIGAREAAGELMKRTRRFAPVPNPAVAFCLGKTRWQSEKGAQRTLTDLRRQNPGAFDSTVRPYRCPACKRWHLGHGA